MPPTWRNFWITIGAIVAALAVASAALFGTAVWLFSGVHVIDRFWDTPPLYPRHIDQLRTGATIYMSDSEATFYLIAKRDLNADAIGQLRLNGPSGAQLDSAAIQKIVAEHSAKNQALFVGTMTGSVGCVVPLPTDFDVQSGVVYAIPAITPIRRPDGGVLLTITKQTKYPPETTP